MKRLVAAFSLAILLAGCAPAATPTSHPKGTATVAGSSNSGGEAQTDESALVVAWDKDKGILRRVYLENGQPLRELPSVDLGMYAVQSMSEDGKLLAVYRYPNNNSPTRGTLHIVDTQTLEDTAIEGITFSNWVNLMAFSSDRKRLLIVYNGKPEGPHGMPVDNRLALVDVRRQTILAEASFDFSPRVVVFAPDGKSIRMYGTSYDPNTGLTGAPPQAALLDGQNLQTLWAVTLNGLQDGQFQNEDVDIADEHAFVTWQPAAIFSVDRNKLYLVHADEDRLTTVDLDRQTVKSIQIAPQQTLLDWFMRLGAGTAHAKATEGVSLQAVLSPDGSKLYVVGTLMDMTQDSNNEPQFSATSLNLRVVEVESGVLLDTIETEATQIVISPDRRLVFLYYYSQNSNNMTTEVLDASTLEPLAVIKDQQVTPVRLTDGRIALLGAQWNFDGNESTLSVLDSATMTELANWTTEDYYYWLATP